MRCSKAREFLSRHLDDQLPPAQTGELDRHLDGCDDCRQYQADLRIGQRLLAATEPELPENFDWKLQLRLNQTLREAAGDAVFPWEETPTVDRWAFLRSFGGAAAAGMAAVLALAMFVGPQVAPRGAALLAGGGAAPATMTAAGDWDASDRLTIYSNQSRRSLFDRSSPGLQTVSGSGVEEAWRRGSTEAWRGRSRGAEQTIQHLRLENRQLRAIVARYERHYAAQQTRLDTTEAGPLDLGDDR